MKQHFDLIIFDLDGTLIDSRIDLVNSVNYTRLQMGLSSLPHELIFTYIGDGAALLIRRALGEGLQEEDVKAALAIFMDHYRQHLLDHTVLYPSVASTLSSLSHLQLAILSNKPVEPSLTILDGLKVRDRFVQIYGGDSFEQKKPHPIGVQTLLAECGVAASGAMMVGDSDVDIRTARNAGILACGVSYGFQPETLEEVKPDILVDHMEEMADLVIAARKKTGEKK